MARENTTPELRLYLDVVLHAASDLTDESFGKVMKRAAVYAGNGCNVRDESGLNELELYVLRELCQSIDRTEAARAELSKKNQRNRYVNDAVAWFNVADKNMLTEEDIDYFIECFKNSGVQSPMMFRLRFPIDGR